MALLDNVPKLPNAGGAALGKAVCGAPNPLPRSPVDWCCCCRLLLGCDRVRLALPKAGAAIDVGVPKVGVEVPNVVGANPTGFGVLLGGILGR